MLVDQSALLGFDASWLQYLLVKDLDIVIVQRRALRGFLVWVLWLGNMYQTEI